MIFGGAARSYDRNTFSILQHETNKATLYAPTVQFWNDSDPVNNTCPPSTLNDPFCIPWDDAYLTPEGLASIAPGNFGEMHFINNNLDAPYSDQFTLGMRNRLGDWNTSAAFAYITSYDGVIASSGNFFGDGTWYWYDSFFWYAFGSAPIAERRRRRRSSSSTTPRRPGPSRSCSPPKSRTARNRAGPRASRTRIPTRRRGSNSTATTSSTTPSRITRRTSVRARFRSTASSLSATIDVPWGITLGAKMVVETPKPLSCICTFDVNAPPPNGLNYNYVKDTSVSGRYDRLFHAGSAGDEDVRVRQWICHPVALRRAQRHESRELRRSDPAQLRRRCAATVLPARMGISRACRAPSS